MVKINNLQETFPTDVSGLVIENNLAAWRMAKVQNVSELITRIYDVNCEPDLESYLSKTGIKTLETEDDFRWMMEDDEEKNIPLLEARLTSGGSAISSTDKLGLGLTRFYLLFPEAYFSATNLIIGNREQYPIRICSDPTPEGSNWEYECELMLGSLTAFIPYDEVQANIRFSLEWSPQEQTLSRRGGTPNYSGPFSFKNCFTNLRWQVTHPGNMLHRPVEFKWVELDKNNKYVEHKTWMEHADWTFKKKLKREMCRAMLFARQNKDENDVYRNIGDSKFEIRQGSGLREQMETSNSTYYSTFSIDKLTEKIIDMTAGKFNQNAKKVLLRTGEWGLYQFHKSLENKTGLYTALCDNNRVQYNGDKITYRGYFGSYRGPNDVQIDVQQEPLYDNGARNKIFSATGPGVAESKRYDILFAGDVNGDPNIQIVKPKVGASSSIYIQGMRSPYNLDSNNAQASSPEDGFSEHVQEIFAIMLRNPKLTAQYIPSELA